MSCNKTKIAFYNEGKIYTSVTYETEIIDGTSDYSNIEGVGKGIVVLDENDIPFFYQTDVNTQIKAVIEDMITAFNITAIPTPTDPWAVEFNTKLQILIGKLDIINKIIP